MQDLNLALEQQFSFHLLLYRSAVPRPPELWGRNPLGEPPSLVAEACVSDSCPNSPIWARKTNPGMRKVPCDQGTSSWALEDLNL